MNQSLFANIPQEMRKRPQWICYKLQPRDGKKPLKLPIDPKTGKAARVNDAATWASFDEATAAAPRFSGIGYVFTENDPYTGIDLDDVLDDAGNILYDDAKDIITAADSYTEISQSGHGVHIIGHCKLEAGEAGRKAASGDKCEKEIYDRNRYFIFTGNIYEGLFYLHDITETAREIVHEIKEGNRPSEPSRTAEPQAITPPAYQNEMTRDEARAYIVAHWGDILRTWTGTAKKKIRGKETFICPHCGHGKGGDGITNTITRPDILKCFSCEFKGDIIQLWENEKHVDYVTAINELAALLGITVKAYTPASNGFNVTFTGDELDGEARAKQEKEENTMTATTQAAPPIKYIENVDYEPYFLECLTRIQRDGENEKAISYLKSRGIDLNTALSYGIGYDPAADPGNAPGAKDYQTKKHPAARLIIPCDKGYFTTRAIDETAVPKDYWKMHAKKSGQKTKHILAPEWIYTADYIFICEGVFDALSIAQVGDGAAAIALNSTSNAGELIEEFEKRRPAGVVLLALDNDKAGKAATEKIAEGLKRLTIPYAAADICGECKDPNEALQKDPAALAAAIAAAKEKATRPDGIGAYLTSGAYDKDIKNIIPPISTGFNILDLKSGGGIRTELYVLSAPSSIGKTTFCLQLACKLAGNGRDVLYFAMEQSRLELVNKCIARESCGINRNKAITAMEAGSPQAWQAETARKAREALADRVGNRLSIIEWNLDATTGALKNYILAYLKYNEKRNAAPPVVFIDYLQLIQGIEINGRTQQIREIMNNTISEMKKISRSEHIPIICIASQARDKYDKPFEMGNIKESGNIEYTAGVVWGLQFTEIEERANDKTYSPELKKLKLENPRKVTLTCDKNRGYTGAYQVNFDYYPAYDYFTESKNQEISGFNIKF